MLKPCLLATNNIKKVFMDKSYPKILNRVNEHVKVLSKDIPDTMSGFSAMGKGAIESGALDKKTKKLIALALGVSARCDGCIGIHTRDLIELGASKKEIEEAVGVAVYMGGGPALMYAAEALLAYEQFS